MDRGGVGMIKYAQGRDKEVVAYRVVQPIYKCNWCGENLHDRYHKSVRMGKDGLDYCSEYCAHESWIAQENDRCKRWT